MHTPLEGIDVDGQVERGTQVNSEEDMQMIHVHTNTEVNGDVHCITRKKIATHEPLLL